MRIGNRENTPTLSNALFMSVISSENSVNNTISNRGIPMGKLNARDRIFFSLSNLNLTAYRRRAYNSSQHSGILDENKCAPRTLIRN